jgi:multidrug efflux system membrane fusion protein
MKDPDHVSRPSRPGLVSAAIIAIGAAMAWYVYDRSVSRPSSDAASIDTEVVHIAAAVGGRVIEIEVEENEKVERGDVLFRIDPLPYKLAVDQAEADLGVAEAALDAQRRVISTEKSNLQIAGEQIKRAQTNYDLAVRTTERLRPLAGKAYVPTQQLDQAQSAQRDAATSLAQAREQENAAQRAISTIEGPAAAIRARQAALAIAKRALEDTVVRAPHDGRIVGLTVKSGEIVAPMQNLFTLVTTGKWYAVVNFRETDLKFIAPEDCATVYSMIDRRTPIKGVVESIGWGVLDTDRVNLPKNMPYVERSLNWVRVAQRFPVRVRLANPPENLMRLGASAVVEVKHGAACS